MTQPPKTRTRARRSRLRSKSFESKKRSQFEAQLGVVQGAPIEYDLDALRPRSRNECRGAMRPCPWVGCRHHFYLDVNPETGSIKINFPDLEPWELVESCVLDVSDRGGITLEQTAQLMNLTRERARQIELVGLHALKAQPVVAEIRSA